MPVRRPKTSSIRSAMMARIWSRAADFKITTTLDLDLYNQSVCVMQTQFARLSKATPTNLTPLRQTVAPPRAICPR